MPVRSLTIMSAKTNEPEASLDAVAEVFAAQGWLRGRNGARELRAGRERAALSLTGLDGCAPAHELVVVPFAGALAAAAIAERPRGAEQLSALIDELSAAGIAPLGLLREALRAPLLQTLEPSTGTEIALALLAACARLRNVSLWSRDSTGRIACLCHLGSASPSANAARLACASIAGRQEEPRPGGEMQALPIVRGGEPVAAMVARSRRGGRARSAAFLAEVQAPLAAILERGSLLASNAAAERLLLQASERRLTRLGFDLHDGPLQELLLVGEDLALFRRQLAIVLEGRRGRELLGGRLDDLDARLVALERGLRGISSSVHADVLVGRPFRDALADLIERFAARSGIEPTVDCDGDLESISTSQRLAVLSVVGEALNNVREHGEASSVSVAITLDRDGLRARVSDDGRGFDVERELLRAARRGHMGLAGMHERVRLLDGRCRVDSRPGGPTEVTLSLPRWHGPGVVADGEGSPARLRGGG